MSASSLHWSGYAPSTATAAPSCAPTTSVQAWSSWSPCLPIKKLPTSACAGQVTLQSLQHVPSNVSAGSSLINCRKESNTAAEGRSHSVDQKYHLTTGKVQLKVPQNVMVRSGAPLQVSSFLIESRSHRRKVVCLPAPKQLPQPARRLRMNASVCAPGFQRDRRCEQYEVLCESEASDAIIFMRILCKILCTSDAAATRSSVQ